MIAARPKRAFGVKDLEEFTAGMQQLRADLEPPATPGGFVAYTDGACLGNPEGPGGWAAVVDVNPPVPTIVPWLLWGHLSSTSNNRAEALGVLAALEWLPPESRLALHSDSEITVRVLQGRYKAKANPDIWEVIRRTISEKKLSVTAEWVRGHAGDPRNELADRLSKLGATDGDSLAAIDAVVGLPSGPVQADPTELAGLEARGDWERDFLRSIAKQLRKGRGLSPKQQAVIDKIRARAAPG